MGQLQQQTTSFEAFAHNTMMKTETIALLMAALLALSAVTHPVMAQDRDDPDADRDADEADRDDDTDEDTDETDFPYEGTAGTSLALRTQIDTEAERSEERANPLS